MNTEAGDTSLATALVGHNTWANLRLLDYCAGLSDEQLDSTATGVYGSIRATLLHFIYSEVDYVNIATEKWPTVILPENEFVSFALFRDSVRWAGDELLAMASAARADTLVRVVRPAEPIYVYPLALFMAQILSHSTEHRTQIATVITTLGLQPPALSGWAYMRALGVFHEYPAADASVNDGS